MMNEYQLNSFLSIDKAFCDPHTPTLLNWNELVELFSHNEIQQKKESAMLFNFCKFKTKGYSYPIFNNIELTEYCKRAKENVEEIQLLVLDIDESMSIDEAKQAFAPYSFILFTTFRHTTEKNKFRMILKISTPIPTLEFDKRKRNFANYFVCDAASFSVSQCFYYPSHSDNNKDIVEFYVNEGIAFNWKEIAEDESWKPTKEYTPSSYKNDPDFQHTYSTSEVIKSLCSLQNFHYGNGSLILATICKGFKLTREEFDVVCNSQSESESLQKKFIRNDLWNKAYERCTKETFEKFLRDNNSSYKPMNHYQELMKLSDDELRAICKSKNIKGY